MKSKASIFIAAVFFSWNVMFGAFGGLLLCLHDNSELHSELISAEPENCHIADSETNCSINDLTLPEACVDVELRAVNLPQLRLDEVQSIQVLDSLDFATSEATGHNCTLRELTHCIQAHAPPELSQTSVLVAQTTNLRI